MFLKRGNEKKRGNYDIELVEDFLYKNKDEC
jgi:hypothetical protein